MTNYTYSVSATTSSGLTVSANQSIGVFSGGIAIDIALAGIEAISAGGSAVDTTVNGGTLTVFASGVASGTHLASGANEIVSRGGSARNETVNSGGALTVSSGGTADDTAVNSGGSAFVYAGGSASGTIVNVSGLQYVSGGTDIAAVISGGVEMVEAGGTASGATLSGEENASGTFFVASQVVLSGGIASATKVDGFGEQDVSGGTAYAPVVSGGDLYLESGTVSGAILLSGGVQYDDGGKAIVTTVSSGGVEYVEFGVYATGSSGDLATGTIIRNGGMQIVDGGIASATVVSSGGTQFVVSDDTLVISGSGTVGTAFATVISSGGGQFVSSGGSVYDTKVNGGGSQTLGSGGTASGTVVSAGGSEVVSGGTAYGTILAGGSETIISGGSVTGYVDFTRSGSDLGLGGSAPTSATISGFGAGDTVDLLNIAPTSSGPVPFNSATGVLTITEGGSAYTLQFDPAHSYAGDMFSALPDGSDGTDITVTCFCAGTHIATPGGETVVENLQVGDLVCLADGRGAPVRWVGRQTVSRHSADPPRVLPVCIRAGALAHAVPARDLLLSPGHALLLDGMLVQAGALVNGTSIIYLTCVAATFCYYHIELDTHDVLLAEGAAAESYLGGVEPMSFDNAPTRTVLETAFELPYPRVKAQRQVPTAIKLRIAARLNPVGANLAA